MAHEDVAPASLIVDAHSSALLLNRSPSSLSPCLHSSEKSAMAALSDFIQSLCGQCGRHPYRTVAFLAISGFIFAWIFSTVRQYRRLRHFKGPPLAAVSKFWHLKTATSPRAYLELYEVTQKYGEVSRLLDSPPPSPQKPLVWGHL